MTAYLVYPGSYMRYL